MGESKYNIKKEEWSHHTMHCGSHLRPGCWFSDGRTFGALTDRFVPSVKAFILIPIVGSMFADFINSIIITFFINLLV